MPSRLSPHVYSRCMMFCGSFVAAPFIVRVSPFGMCSSLLATACIDFAAVVIVILAARVDPVLLPAFRIVASHLTAQLDEVFSADAALFYFWRASLARAIACSSFTLLRPSALSIST